MHINFFKKSAFVVALSISALPSHASPAGCTSTYCYAEGTINSIFYSSAANNPNTLKVKLNDGINVPPPGAHLSCVQQSQPSEWVQLSTDSMNSLATAAYLSGKNVQLVSFACVTGTNIPLIQEIYLK